MKREEHLLAILEEEALEVAQRVSKILRFGMDEIQPGQENLTNRERLERELNDLWAMCEMCGVAKVDRVLVDQKKSKVERFLVYSKKCGTLDE